MPRLSFALLPVVLVAVLLGNPAAAQTVLFEDVTTAAGLDFVHWVPAPADPLYCAEAPHMSGGAAAGDFDNDGWTDIYVTRIEQPNLLFRNLGDGTFAEVGAAAGVAFVGKCSGCAWGDVNNDGFLDLYLVAMEVFPGPGRNYLFMNDGAGHFIEDAVVRGADVPCPACRHRNTSAAFGDYDLDGDLDLHVVEWTGTNALNVLLRNDGTGMFQDVTTPAGVRASGMYGFANGFADMDGDGWADLLVAADFGTSRLFRNLGGGAFTDITISAGVGTDENGMGAAIGDMDNDGDLDWFVTSIFDPADTCLSQPCMWGASGNRLFRNDTGTGFTDVTDTAGVRDGGWGWGASFFDFDNDGDLDLGMTNGVIFPCISWEDPFNADPLRLWQNDGSGNMTEVSAALQFSDTRSGKAFVVFDYDRDGDRDVFIVNNADGPILLRNNGGNGRDWLQVSLRGSWTNHFGIGARVHVQATPLGPTQLREINANSNFMSQNEVVAHFGLGSGVTTIHSVRVDWPASGLSQTFVDVAPNQRLLIQEPVSLKGDVNLDAVVNGADINDMLAAQIGGVLSLPVQGWAADVNDDGAVDPGDLPPFVNLLLQP